MSLFGAKLSADIICSEKRTAFRERSSKKTVSSEELTTCKDKYPSILLKPNGDYCVYYPSVQMFFPTRIWGISQIQSKEMHLDQSRIWWIITQVICLVRTTSMESAMAIFEHNVLNNKVKHRWASKPFIFVTNLSQKLKSNHCENRKLTSSYLLNILSIQIGDELKILNKNTTELNVRGCPTTTKPVWICLKSNSTFPTRKNTTTRCGEVVKRRPWGSLRTQTYFRLSVLSARKVLGREKR